MDQIAAAKAIGGLRRPVKTQHQDSATIRSCQYMTDLNTNDISNGNMLVRTTCAIRAMEQSELNPLRQVGSAEVFLELFSCRFVYALLRSRLQEYKHRSTSSDGKW